MNRFLPLLFGCLALMIAGCASAPSSRVAAAEQVEWFLEADNKSATSVTLRKGDTKESVLERLGRPKKKEKTKADPALETYLYERRVTGPLVQRTEKTTRGMMIIRQHVLYLDLVTISFRNDAIETVEVERRLERDDPSITQLDERKRRAEGVLGQTSPT